VAAFQKAIQSLPGLDIESLEIMRTVTSCLEAASATLTQGTSGQGMAMNLFSQGAIKVRFLRLGLERWTTLISEKMGDASLEDGVYGTSGLEGIGTVGITNTTSNNLPGQWHAGPSAGASTDDSFLWVNQGLSAGWPADFSEGFDSLGVLDMPWDWNSMALNAFGTYEQFEP
jgi:hypothetical protein